MDFVSLAPWKKALGSLGLMISFASLGMPAPSVQAAPSASSPQFGSVSLDRIATGYTKKADLDKQVEDLNQKLQAQFNLQQSSVMLSKDQLQRLGTLATKSPRTDAETAEMTSLQQQATRDAQELTALQQKASPTDADKARLTTLTSEQQAGAQALQDISGSYTSQVQALQDRLSSQLSDQIKAAIAAVAQQRGLALVFDARFAVYSGNDVTDDVIKKLNGK